MSNGAPDGWDDRQAAKGASFLQSAGWAEFQDSLGYSTFFLEAEGWSCLLVERRNRAGRYLFAPYGPTVVSMKQLPGCLETLETFGRQHSADWLKLEPVCVSAETSALTGQLRAAGFRRADHDVDPHLTRVLDLMPAENEILAKVSQSTRSLIRKNQRENTLSFHTSSSPQDINHFLTMLHQVVQRNQVYFYDDGYFQKQADLLMPKGMMHLELAFHEGNPVAAAVMQDFGGTSAYAYAASKAEARQMNASALLLWQSIINAKRRGCSRLDLFGIAPDDAPPSHPWYGFSVYKRKFGGEVVERSGSWDLPLSKRFMLYRRAQSVNRHLRRLRR